MSTLTITAPATAPHALATHITTREEFLLQRLEEKPELHRTEAKEREFVIALIDSLHKGVEFNEWESEAVLTIAIVTDKLLSDTKHNLENGADDAEWGRSADQWHNLQAIARHSPRYAEPILNMIRKATWVTDYEVDRLPSGLEKLALRVATQAAGLDT